MLSGWVSSMSLARYGTSRCVGRSLTSPADLCTDRGRTPMKVAIAPADLMEGLNGDPEFRLAARYLNANVELRIGDDKPYILSILDGEVVKVAREVGHPGRSILRISAPTSDWVKLLQSTPEPFYLDFYSASVHHGFRLTGDMDVLWAYYPALRRMPELLRVIANVEGA